MKVHKFHLLAASAAMMAFLGVQTVIAKQKGTSIYHFMVSATMEDGAAEGDAQGTSTSMAHLRSKMTYLGTNPW